MITLDYNEQIRVIKNLYKLSNEFWADGDDKRGCVLSEAVGLLLQQLILDFDLVEIIDKALEDKIYHGYEPIIAILEKSINQYNQKLKDRD